MLRYNNQFNKRALLYELSANQIRDQKYTFVLQHVIYDHHVR